MQRQAKLNLQHQKLQPHVKPVAVTGKRKADPVENHHFVRPAPSQRHLSGFERFLRKPSLSELLSSSAAGTICRLHRSASESLEKLASQLSKTYDEDMMKPSFLIRPVPCTVVKMVPTLTGRIASGIKLSIVKRPHIRKPRGLSKMDQLSLAAELVSRSQSSTTSSSQHSTASRKHSLSHVSQSPSKVAKSKATGPMGSPITNYFRPTPPTTPTHQPTVAPQPAGRAAPVTPSRLFKLFADVAELHRTTHDENKSVSPVTSQPAVPEAFSFEEYRTSSAPSRSASRRHSDAWRTSLSRAEIAHLARGGSVQHVASVLDVGQKIQALIQAAQGKH